MIVEEDYSPDQGANKTSINYSAPDSIHSRLVMIMLSFLNLQKSIISDPTPGLRDKLVDICNTLAGLCDENSNQVLGELYLSDTRFYSYVKPLYIAASVKALIHRFNQIDSGQAFSKEKMHNLMQAAMLHNLGLLNSQYQDYSHNRRLTTAQRSEILQLYPRASLQAAEKIGLTEADTLDAIRHHNIPSLETSLEARLLRIPFVYAGIAMRGSERLGVDIVNPTREFTKMLTEKKLDPELGGLFLKINGITPIGSILEFESNEKAIVISGPEESSSISSTLRMITNREGVQLSRPGEKFRLDQTGLVHKGLADHLQFSWDSFLPFVAWEK